MATRGVQHMTRMVFFVFLVPLLVLVMIYPFFSVRSYFDSLRTYKGLYGLTWLMEEYPDDYNAILWLKTEISNKQEAISKDGNVSRITYHASLPVIVEADGDSYTDYARFSAFTGLPTIVGWPVHEWLWRGSYDVVAPRREDVRKIYESDDVEETRKLLETYHVQYIVVGVLERKKYPSLREDKIALIGKRVFTSGETAIYSVY
jgi:uncharacterized membrane protein